MDDYRIEEKANNKVAYCNGCDSYIKNIPHAEPTLFFGKYKNWKVCELQDLNYLDWLRANVKLSAALRSAVDQQISSLSLTHP